MSGEGNDDGREMRKEGRRGSIKRRRKKMKSRKGKKSEKRRGKKSERQRGSRRKRRAVWRGRMNNRKGWRREEATRRVWKWSMMKEGRVRKREGKRR